MKRTIVYLPPYSPDLNPIEFIWKVLKKIYLETIHIRYRRDYKTVYKRILQTKFKIKLFKEIYKQYAQKYKFKTVFQNILKKHYKNMVDKIL